MKILHIIDSLDKIGGAEKLLEQYVNNMKNHEHLIVVLNGGSILNFNDNIKIESLGFKGFSKIFYSVNKLQSIFNNYRPKIIHAHLPLSTFIARLINRKNTKFFFSIHNTYSESLKKTSKYLFWMEKLFSNSTQTAIFVSETVKDDYFNLIKFKGKYHILHNFISDCFFLEPYAKPFKNKDEIKLVAIGNVKAQKNYDFLIQCIKELELPFTLDIYGSGEIKETDSKIRFRGWRNNIHKILPNYDIYISSSIYEGFGIAPLEAAAKKLPILLSDLKVYREVTDGKAYYFDPYDKESLKERLCFIYNNFDLSIKKMEDLNSYVIENFRINNYVNKLLNIYSN